MKRIVLAVPGMYGDHHVLRVRQVLLGVNGVDEVVASAARRSATVAYDERLASPDAIREALIAAGYLLEPVPETGEPRKRHEDGSGWYQIHDRCTTTEFKDREMAGDFRRY